MIIEPELLICPHCEQKYSHIAFVSGNTFGAIYYSDGKRKAQMLYDEVAIIKCVQCKQFVWVRDMEKAIVFSKVKSGRPGMYASIEERLARREEIRSAQREEKSLRETFAKEGVSTKPLTLEELAEALDANVAKNEGEERHLRITLWRLFNDRIRNFWETPKESDLWETDEEKKLWNENLDALYNLLDASVQDEQLMQAEICRERSEFDRAIEILDGITEDKYQKIVQEIRHHCQEGNPFVFRRNFS